MYGKEITDIQLQYTNILNMRFVFFILHVINKYIINVSTF